MDEGLLIARVVFGSLFAIHGCQKLFGWFGGYGIGGTATFFEGLGFRPGRIFVIADAVTECGGGLCLALGLFQPLAAAAIVAGMIVAIATVHWHNGLLVTTNGIEVPLLYATVAVSLALTGPGLYSLDAFLGLNAWWTPASTISALAAGAAGGLAALAMRRPASAVAHS